MATARASHLLVQTEQECNDLKEKINNGEISFEDAAKEHSQCPSGNDGGSLGTFPKGMMVPEFDAVVFNDEIGVVHGPVKTQFGYHLLKIIERND